MCIYSREVLWQFRIDRTPENRELGFLEKYSCSSTWWVTRKQQWFCFGHSNIKLATCQHNFDDSFSIFHTEIQKILIHPYNIPIDFLNFTTIFIIIHLSKDSQYNWNLKQVNKQRSIKLKVATCGKIWFYTNLW